MGFLDFFDLLGNTSKTTEIPNLMKTYFEKFTDKNEYLGERIKSFISFLLSLSILIAVVFGIVFLTYKLLNRF